MAWTSEWEARTEEFLKLVKEMKELRKAIKESNKVTKKQGEILEKYTPYSRQKGGRVVGGSGEWVKSQDVAEYLDRLEKQTMGGKEGYYPLAGQMDVREAKRKASRQAAYKKSLERQRMEKWNREALDISTPPTPSAQARADMIGEAPPSGDGGEKFRVPSEVPMIGGMGAMGMIQQIVKWVVEAIQSLIENLYELAEAAGAPFAGWTRPMEETAGQIISGEKAPHEMVIAIFDALTNLMKKVIQFAGIPKLFNLFNTLMDLISNPAFEIFSKILKGLGGIFKALLGPLEPIFTLLGIVADIINAALAPVLKELAEEIGPIVEDMFKAIEDFDVGDLSSLGESMIDLGKALVELIEEILSDPEGLINMFEKIIDFVAAIMGIAPDIINRMIDFLLMFMETDEEGVTVFEDIIYSVLDLAERIINNSGTLMDFVDALITLTEGAVKVGGAVMGAWEWFKGIGPAIGTAIWDWLDLISWGQPGTAQGGAFINKDKPMMLHAGEFVFTPEQTIELSKMGLGADKTTARNLEESAKYSKKLYQLFERNARFMF